MKHFSKIVLLNFLCLIAASTAIDTFFAMSLHPLPQWWKISSTVILSATIFAWYYHDAAELGFVRSRGLNISVAAVAIVGIPYYLFRSRAGRRIKVFLKLFGFALLTLAAASVGSLAAWLIS